MGKKENKAARKNILGLGCVFCLILLILCTAGCKTTSPEDGEKKYNPFSAKERKLNEIETKISKLYGDADKAQRNGKIHDARKAYEEILAIYDENKENKDLKRDVEPYCRLGVIMETFGQFDAAENYYRQAMEFAPKDPVPLNSLGYCYLTQKRIDDAIVYFQKAVELAPLEPKYNNNLGLAYGLKKDYQHAFECFRRVTSEDEAYYNLSSLFAMNNEEEKARAALEQVVALNPTHREAKRLLTSYSEAEQDPEFFESASASGNYYGSMVPYEEVKHANSIGSSAMGSMPTEGASSMPGAAGTPSFTKTYGSIHHLQK